MRNDFTHCTYSQYVLCLKRPYVVFFTGARINRDTVPEGLYLYEIRSINDNCKTIERTVGVDFYESMITTEPLDDEFEADLTGTMYCEMGKRACLYQRDVNSSFVERVRDSGVFVNTDAFVSWLNIKLSYDGCYEVDKDNCSVYLNDLLYQFVRLNNKVIWEYPHEFGYILPSFATKSKQHDIYHYKIDKGLIML